MKSRHLYKREMQWITGHSLLITTNYRPAVSETDHDTCPDSWIWPTLNPRNRLYGDLTAPEPI
ncbi:hypothetical protein [Streptomyces cinereoruber]|uniref:hypothetical protein n=1 Tax=Streptomyces cinereoruber TaxID=67260 RepID=UPI003636076E